VRAKPNRENIFDDLIYIDASVVFTDNLFTDCRFKTDNRRAVGKMMGILSGQ